MTQNDFFVAIQGILLQAREQGWSDDRIYDYGLEAMEEFAEEYLLEVDLDDN